MANAKKVGGAGAKHITVKARAKLKAKPRRKPVIFNPLPQAEPVGEQQIAAYEESMLRRISARKAPNEKDMVPYDAILMCSAVSSMSSEMENIRYNFGVYLGRMLYRQNYQIKRYTLPEEPIPDLVSFMESAGYSHLTYSAFADRPEVKMFNKSATNLSINAHAFESGIISGYISGITNKLAPVYEITCTSNGAEHCWFAYDYNRAQAASSTPRIDTLDKFAGVLVEHSAEMQVHPSGQRGVSRDYLSLAWTPLLDRSYNEEVGKIVYFIGYSAGAKLFNEQPRKGNLQPLYERALGIGMSLGFGIPKLVSAKPLRFRIRFDMVLSRTEFVNIALSFYYGIFSKAGVGELSASQTTGSAGTYTADIKEAVKIANR